MNVLSKHNHIQLCGILPSLPILFIFVAIIFVVET